MKRRRGTELMRRGNGLRSRGIVRMLREKGVGVGEYK